MCAAFTIEDPDATILVEFAPRPGVQPASLGTLSLDDLAEKSAQALDQAMATIRQMAQRVVATVDKITDPPSQVEVEFGLKFDAEAGAVVAKAGAEAGFNVTLTWERKEKSAAKT